MPFKSEKQRRFMFAKHPDIARRFVADAKAKGEPVVQPDAQTKHLADALRKHGKKRS